MGLPWWITLFTALLGGGVALMTTFAPTAIPPNWHVPLFWIGFAILLVGLGPSFHWFFADKLLLSKGAGLYPALLATYGVLAILLAIAWFIIEQRNLGTRDASLAKIPQAARAP